MPFDIQKMMNQKYTPREEKIPVPDLKEFFQEGEEPIIIVRSLEGFELAEINEHIEKYRNLAKLIEGFLSTNNQEKIAAIKESMGFSGKVPDDFAKRLKMLTLGSVSPKFEQDQAVKFAKIYPIEFYQITNKITLLTGMGSIPGESKPSIAGQI